MADVNENINIKFNISGIDTSKLNSLADFFKKISENSKDSTSTIGKVTDNLVRLSKVKLPKLESFANGVKNLASYDVKLTKLASNFDELQQSINKVSDLKLPSLSRFATGVTSVANLSSKLQALRDNLTEISTAIRSVGEITLPGVTSFVNGLKKIEDLKIGNIRTKIEALAKSINKLDKSGKLESFTNFAKNLNTVANAANNLTNANGKLAKSTQTVGDRLTTLRDKFASYGQYRLIADSIIFVQQAFEAGVAAIIDYDQALKDLQAITGATISEIGQISEVILDIASSTKFSSTEVAEGLKLIGQAGFTASESIEAVEGIANLATGTLTSMELTVDLVTTALRVFNLEADKTSNVADVFANAVNRSKLNIDKLRTAFNYVGPIASTAGVTLEQTAAAMATLANAGLRASTIGTGLRQVFATLLSPTKKFTDAVIASGVSMEALDLRTNSVQSVINALKLVVTDAGVALDAFGKRGASAVLALIEDDNYLELENQISRAGTAAEQAEIQTEGLGIMIKNLSDRAAVLAVALGELGITDILKITVTVVKALIIAITTLVNNPIAQWIAKSALLVTGIQALVLAINLLRAGVIPQIITALSAYVAQLVAVNTVTGTATGIMGTFQIAVASTTASFAPLTAALGAATVAVRAFFASLGPVGAIITALGLAISFAFAGDALASVFGMKKALGDLADEADALADKYDNLGDAAQKYKDNSEGLRLGSFELKKESADLRNELLETARKYPELYNAAKAAADSINIFDGSLLDGGAALDAYQQKIDDVKFDNMVKSLELSVESLQDSGFWERNAEGLKATFIGNLTFQKRDVQGVYDNLNSGLEVVRLYAENTAESFQKAGDIIRSWDMTNLTDFQKRLVADADRTSESYTKIISDLRDAGQITLDTTREEFEKLISKSTESKGAIVGIVATFERLKQAAQDAADDIQLVDYSKIISPKDLLNTFDLYITQAETKYQKHLENIALLEAQGVYTTEQAESERTTATLTFYESKLKKAQETLDKIVELGAQETEEYAKALKKKEAAEADLFEKRRKFLVEYTAEATKANEKLVKVNEDYEDEVEKHESKLQKIKQKSTTKLEKIHETYTKKLEKIDEKYQEDLQKLEDKRAANKKKSLDEINDIEQSAAEAIRKIRERDLSDEEKQASQRKAALDYLEDGLDAVQNFNIETTTESDLERSKQLLEDALGLTDAFDSQSRAIRLVKEASEGLKKVSAFEEELADAKFLKEEEELLAQKKKDKVAEEEEYKKKLEDSKQATLALINEENKRHSNELANQLKELNLYKEKLRIAKQLVSLSGGSLNLQQNVTYNTNIDAIKNDLSALQSEADRAFGGVSQSISGSFDTAYNSIRNDGQAAFSDVSDSAIDSFNRLYTYTADNGTRFFTNIYNKQAFDKYLSQTQDAIDSADLSVDPEVDEDGEIEKFKEEVKEIDNLNDEYDLTASVSGMNELNSLIQKVENLRDKVVTVTTRYVTQGAESTLTAATGMRLPGFGGGDRRPALLEDGEWVIRKEAVRKYGDWFLNAINTMSLPGFREGGSITPTLNSTVQKKQVSGSSSFQDFGKVILDTGKMKVPVMAHRNVVSELNRHMRKASLMGANNG